MAGFQAAVSYMWLPEEAYDEAACKKAVNLLTCFA